MTGPMLCTAGRPGACSPSIGSGAAGSACATPVTPADSNAADEPTAIAVVSIVLIVVMVPQYVSIGVGWVGWRQPGVRAVPTAG